MGLLFFASVLGYTIGIKALFPKMRPGASLLTSVCSMVFLSYLFIILFGLYRFGAYSVMILGFVVGAAGVATDIFLRKKGESFIGILSSWRQTYLTPSIAVFLALTLGSAILLRGMQAFPSHDNYSFWARAVREMWVFDSSYINVSSNIAHSDYCAAIPALQYSVVRVFGWKNEYLCYVLVAIVAAAFAAIYDKFTWKNKLCVLFCTVSCLVLYPMTSNTFDFDELLIDGPLAMLFVSALLLWTSRDDDSVESILPIAAAAFVLVTAKLYVGLMLAAVLFAAVFIHWLKNKHTMHYASVLAMALLIVFAQFSWSAYYNYSTAVRNYEIKAAQSEYLGIEHEDNEKPAFSLSYMFEGNPRNGKLTDGLNGEKINENLQFAKPYMLDVFTSKLNGATSPNVTLFSITMLTVLAMAATAYLASEKLRKNMLYSCLLTGISSVVYAAGMLVTFLIVQPEAATSTIRYVGIILIILQNVLFYYLAQLLTENNRTVLGFSALIIAAMVMYVSPEQVYNTYMIENEYFSEEFARSGIALASEKIDGTDRVLYVENRDAKGKFVSSSGIVYCYQYCALPNYSTAIYHPYGKTDSIDRIEMEWLTDKLAAQRANKLVIMTDDAAYTQKYAHLLGIDESISQPWVFSVEVVQGEYAFVLVES